ncbi:MAG: apolipoprotein N-acyltransferase, partial [Micavibrio aeruginosavorus]
MHYDPPRMFEKPFIRKLLFCLASIASGWIAAFAMSPASFWPCLFVGLSALYYLYSRTERPMQAYAAGFLFGIGYFTTGLWWIGNALLVEGNEFAWVWPISVIGLPTLLSLFTGLYLSIARIMTPPDTAKGFLAFAFFLTLSEWTRGTAFTGFPWNLYGYVWAEHLSMAQSFHYFGAYGMTFVSVAWAAAAGFLYVWNKDPLPKIICIGAVAATMGAMYLVGTARLENNPTTFDTANAVVVVQPNIPQNMKWDPSATQANFIKTVRLSEVPESSFGEDVPENIFIVWPETAISPAVSDMPQNVETLRRMLGGYKVSDAHLVTGILRRKPDMVERDGVMETAYGNSVALIDKNLSNIRFYDKYNLVPFGEFIPFQKW